MVEEDLSTIVSRMHDNRLKIQALEEQIVDDTVRLAELRGSPAGDRSIEEHLQAIAPAEGFALEDITDGDRHQIARVVLDAYILGTAWLTRDDNHGFKREDPLRIEVRDRRVT